MFGFHHPAKPKHMSGFWPARCTGSGIPGKRINVLTKHHREATDSQLWID
jgi:hypothetical protein